MANKTDTKTLIATVPKELHSKIKVLSAQTDRSMGEIFLEALNFYFNPVSASESMVPDPAE